MTTNIIGNTALVESRQLIITDAQSALDFIATVRCDTGCDAVIVDRSAVCEAFFDLKTGIAGEVLQKFVNYSMRLAIVGDFSAYPSRALRDFMRECNEGRSILFVASAEDALKKFGA